MGNLWSHSNSASNQQNKALGVLEARLVNLESLDRNHDSVISKEELDQWMADQKRDLERYVRLKQTEQTQEMLTTISDLKKENKALSEINRRLERQLAEKQTIASRYTPPGTPQAQADLSLFGPISQQRIQDYVEELIQDPDINIKYFPDAVERQIYRNVFKLALGSLDKLFHGSQIEILGHQITLQLASLPEGEAINDDA